MHPHKFTLSFSVFLVVALFAGVDALAQQRKAPTGGRIAVVVDERLAALRSTPQLTGNLVRRLSRGRMVAIRSAKTDRDGVTFLFVNVTTRTRGWIQRESVVSPSRSGDDQRLVHLIENSSAFDRIVRCRIFLDHFRRSPFRPRVLLMLGDTAETLAPQLMEQAQRRLSTNPGDAPAFTYYLNYPGLDRYNRQGVHFLFDRTAKRLHYDGSAWREILKRHPRSSESSEARQRVLTLAKLVP